MVILKGYAFCTHFAGIAVNMPFLSGHHREFWGHKQNFPGKAINKKAINTRTFLFPNCIFLHLFIEPSHSS